MVNNSAPVRVVAVDASAHLTSQELLVLQLLARGYTTRQIAQLLDEPLDAVEVLTTDATTGLGVGTRAEAVAYALRGGMIK